MAGEGGELERIGGDGHRKARIVGGFAGVLLISVAVLLLAVILFLTIRKNRIEPGSSDSQPSGSSMIETAAAAAA